MKEKIQKVKNNKFFKFISNIIYAIVFICILLLLAIVVLQRVSDNQLTLGGYRIFVVATGSMIPKYQVGDVLLAKQVNPETIKVGDDIVYLGKEGSFAGKIISHQVIDIKKNENDYRIVTKGIANITQDPEIDQTQVLGKIVHKIMLLTFFEKIATNNYLFFIFIFIPVALMIYRRIKCIGDICKEDDEEENKK